MDPELIAKQNSAAEYNCSQSSAPPLASQDDLHGFEERQNPHYRTGPTDADEEHEPDFNEREHEDQVHRIYASPTNRILIIFTSTHPYLV